MTANPLPKDGSWNYSIYGLRLKSNLQLATLLVSSQSKKSDITVTFNEVENHTLPPTEVEAIFSSSGIADNGLPFFKVWINSNDPHAYLGIQYTNGTGFTTFLINQDGSQVIVNKTSLIPIQDMLTYFLGPVIGCILSLRRITCLHAGVVAIDGKAFAIIGPKGAGKSTTTAALAECGQAILSDDIAPLSESNHHFIVSPGYLSLRLWPNTIDVLSDVASEHLTKVLSIAEKRFLQLSTDTNAQRWRFHEQPMQLAAVYALKERNQTDTLSIRSLSQAEGLLKLAANVYPEYSLNQGDRARDFDVLGKLVGNTPVREVERPDNLDTLHALRDAIMADFKTLV